VKFLELYGVKKIKIYFNQIKSKNSPKKYNNINELFSSKKIYKLSSIAFLIGTTLTFPLIWLELTLDVFNMDQIIWGNIVIYSLAIIGLVGLEFYLLFLLGFYSVAYYIYHITTMKDLNHNQIEDEKVLISLSRIIMELPEHKEHNNSFNIIHQNQQDKGLFLWTILYKVKVVVSNFLLKFIARKVLAKTSFRVYSPYIATLGTGIWDGIVFYIGIRNVQHKIMVRYSIEKLLIENLDILQKEDTIKAILYRYDIYGEFNANMHYLLEELFLPSSSKIEKPEYSNIKYIENLPKELQVILFATKNKYQNKRERDIIKKLGISKDITLYNKHLTNGNTSFIDNKIKKLKDY